MIWYDTIFFDAISFPIRHWYRIAYHNLSLPLDKFIVSTLSTSSRPQVEFYGNEVRQKIETSNQPISSAEVEKGKPGVSEDRIIQLNRANLLKTPWTEKEQGYYDAVRKNSKF